MFRGLAYRNVVTLGVASVFFAVGLSCFGLDQEGSKSAGADSKTSTGITIQVRASSVLVKLPPETRDLQPLNCEPTEAEVRLYANTTSPHKDDVTFTWQVPVGRLKGKGRKVIWDLTGVQEGTYNATVEASDRHKHSASGSVTVKVVICPSWRPDPPPCPFVSVSCPVKVESKGSVSFVATVSGGNPGITPTIKWKVSAGKIVSGQATPKITVDVSHVRQESVTATVSLGRIDPACNATASCMTEIER